MGAMALRAIGILFFVVILIWLYTMSYARAQERHEQHHPNYQNWVNKADQSCCNNQDCGELAFKNERETAAGTVEVKIDNEWCPVLPQHYLKRGNAPNWSTSHVCVKKQYEGMPLVAACARLLCYQPKPGV